VSDVSRQYAVGSQQALAAAVELAVLAQHMREAVSNFNVEVTDWVPVDAHAVDENSDTWHEGSEHDSEGGPDADFNGGQDEDGTSDGGVAPSELVTA